MSRWLFQIFDWLRFSLGFNSGGGGLIIDRRLQGKSELVALQPTFGSIAQCSNCCGNHAHPITTGMHAVQFAQGTSILQLTVHLVCASLARPFRTSSIFAFTRRYTAYHSQITLSTFLFVTSMWTVPILTGHTSRTGMTCKADTLRRAYIAVFDPPLISVPPFHDSVLLQIYGTATPFFPYRVLILAQSCMRLNGACNDMAYAHEPTWVHAL